MNRATLEDRLLPLIGPALGALFVLALVLPRLMPGVGFWDTGEFQTVGPVLGTAHPTGFPSFVVLGWLASIGLAPFGEPALRINLLSALLAAVAVAAFVVLARRLSGYVLIALAFGAALALDPVLLRLANHADAHVFHLALLATTLALLVIWEERHRARQPADRWLAGAALVYGVAVANHTLALLLAPAIAVFVLLVEPRIVLRPKAFFGALGLAVGVAALFYLELPIRAAMGAPLVYGHPNTWSGFTYVVLAEQFTNGISGLFDDIPGKLSTVVSALSAQMGILLWLVPIGFLAALLRRPRYAIASGLAFLLTCWFAASYINADIERYYLGPVLLALSWLAILGGLLVETLEGIMTPKATPGPAAETEPPPSAGPISSGAALITDGPTPLEPVATPTSRWPRRLNFGLDLSLALLIGALLVSMAPANLAVAGVDESHDTWAIDWTKQALSELTPDAVILSWWSYSTPLWYAQRVQGRRPDIWIVDDRTRLDQNLGSLNDVIDSQLGKRPIYLIRFDSELADLRKSYILAPIPDLNSPLMWQVVGRVSP